ncbi:LysR family transcriptional regulator [Burkholderia sp. Nafp2/4-1b]|uniref:LysR family transcriptional regulator n=1 Tax=Burkholderia sp. Nafp2/4-1b TaxID=2116686 RepID=UPI000EF917D8|nr:LysR family transcriptional regulator [Burkholderia sp. Nafp2/4-1b]RKU00291.1 LysR family transcriptional regulator [Burkholderia sp. Nafp2/4-1b]
MISDQNGEPDSHEMRASMPSLMALRCFEAAARHEHFSRAADELHLTHGAVSRAVRLLEDELGVALFERRSRRVFLTDAGRKLARAVHDGLHLMKQAANELRADAARAQRWMLSCEPTLLMRWLIPRWPDFQATHAGVDIHLAAAGGPFSFDNGIDMAIRRNDFAWPAGYHAERLFAERVGPVCRPDKVATWFADGRNGHALKRGAPRLHTRTRPHAWTEWATAARQSPGSGSGRGQTFDHFYFSLQAAVAGLGVAIGPWHLVRDDLESGVLAAPMGFIEDGSHYCLLTPEPVTAGSAQSSLLDWLRKMA